MSLDRLQSKRGLFQISPEVDYLTTGTGSTAAASQIPGGLAVGSGAGFAPAFATSVGGGALFQTPYPFGTAGQSVTTGGTIFHNGAGYAQIHATVTANNLQFQPPQYAGQFLFVQNVGSVSCSVGTLGTVNNWSTTGTVTAQVLDAAITFPAFVATSTGAAGGNLFIASPGHASTTGIWPVGVWHRVV